MKIIKANRMIIILSFFVNLCLLLSINYSISYTIESRERPYDLGINYVKMENKNFSNNNLIDIVKNDDFDKTLTLIAETKDSTTIGVYDPTMFFYTNSSKVVAPKNYRYFSNYDYFRRTKVGVLVNSCDFFNIEDVKNRDKKYNVDEIINCIENDTESLMNVTLLQNIFSIDSSDIKTIYVDSNDTQKINKVRDTLTQYGFNDVKVSHDNVSIIHSMTTSIFGGRYQQLMIIAGVVMIILFFFMGGLQFSKHKKEIYISQVVGASFPSLLIRTLIGTLLISLLVSILSYAIIIYLEINDLIYLKIQYFLKIESIFILFNCIFYSVNCYAYYLRTKNLERGVL